MTKALAVLAVLSLLFAPISAPRPAQAQEERCFPADLVIAKARAEQPSTDVLARVSGADAAALTDALNLVDDSDRADQAPPADEITVLRSAQSDELLLLGTEAGCLVWRGEMSRVDYEHATWKAFGLPV